MMGLAQHNNNTYPAASPLVAYQESLDGTPSAAQRMQRVEQFISMRPAVVGWVYNSIIQEDGVYLTPVAIGLDTETPKERPAITGFDFLPGIQLGAGDSHHGVLFGVVSITDASGGSAHCDVAIKSFETGGYAEREHDAYLEVARRGLNTFTPIALAKDGEQTYLITEVMPNVETLDNVDWMAVPGDGRYEAEIVPELAFIADQLALMHSKGVFHDDAQPKNIGRNDEGRHVILDLEEAIFAWTEEDLVLMLNGGQDMRDSKAVNDLYHCWRALINPMVHTNEEVPNVLFDGQDRDVCMVEFENRFLKPYLRTLQELLPERVGLAFDAGTFSEVVYRKVEWIT